MTDKNLAQDYADRLAESLDKVWQAIDAGAEIDGQPAIENLEERPLEIVAEIGEPFSILLTCGGPHAEIVWHGRGGTEYAELLTYWGGDRGRRTSQAIRRTAEYFSGVES